MDVLNSIVMPPSCSFAGFSLLAESYQIYPVFTTLYVLILITNTLLGERYMSELSTDTEVASSEEAIRVARSAYHLFYGEKPPLIVKRVIELSDKRGTVYSVMCHQPVGCSITVSAKGSVKILPGGRSIKK
jgi:hypothetical protein